MRVDTDIIAISTVECQQSADEVRALRTELALQPAAATSATTAATTLSSTRPAHTSPAVREKRSHKLALQ